MAETGTGPPDALLEAIKDYLSITWQDDKTDARVKGYIDRGMKRLQNIAGASLDFTVEDLPRSLLYDYCRYANSQALEVFEKNFQAELTDLYLRTQAAIIDDLTVQLSVSDSGVVAKVTPMPDSGDSYVYAAGTGLKLPEQMDVCTPGSGWTAWNGETIPAEAGPEILIVEINEGFQAVRAGKAVIPG